MARNYELAPDDVRDLYFSIIREIAQHRPLEQVELRVLFRLVESTTGSPLRHNGVPSRFTVEIVPDRYRQLNTAKQVVMPDVIICFDKAFWQNASAAHRRAAMDSALTCLMVQGDYDQCEQLVEAADGTPVYSHDAAGRPVVKLRPPDVKIVAHRQAVERNQEYSDASEQLKPVVHMTQRRAWG